MNTTTTDTMNGCHGWRLHFECLQKISALRDEVAIKNLRKDMYYIRCWTERGEVLVYA
jgi:hypothetical protein